MNFIGSHLLNFLGICIAFLMILKVLGEITTTEDEIGPVYCPEPEVLFSPLRNFVMEAQKNKTNVPDLLKDLLREDSNYDDLPRCPPSLEDRETIQEFFLNAKSNGADIMTFFQRIWNESEKLASGNMRSNGQDTQFVTTSIALHSTVIKSIEPLEAPPVSTAASSPAPSPPSVSTDSTISSDIPKETITQQTDPSVVPAVPQS